MLLGLTYLEAVDNLIYVSLLENVSIASRLCLSPHLLFKRVLSDALLGTMFRPFLTNR